MWNIWHIHTTLHCVYTRQSLDSIWNMTRKFPRVFTVHAVSGPVNSHNCSRRRIANLSTLPPPDSTRARTTRVFAALYHPDFMNPKGSSVGLVHLSSVRRIRFCWEKMERKNFGTYWCSRRLLEKARIARQRVSNLAHGRAYTNYPSAPAEPWSVSRDVPTSSTCSLEPKAAASRHPIPAC